MTRQEVAEIVHGMPSGMDADDYLVELVIRAILREREACAKVVEQYCGAWADEGYALAQTIRAGGVDGATVGEVGIWGDSQALAEPANSTTDFVEPILYMDSKQMPKGMPDWKPGMVFPNPKREWVGLTDQEIEDLWNQHERRFDYYSFSCDIEAKLKEKNT